MESSTQSRFRDVIHRYQFSAFVIVTFTFSWSWWATAYAILGDGHLSSVLAMPGAFGPPLAAAILVGINSNSLRAWFSQVLKWRVAPRWYLIVIGLPVVIVLAGVGGALALAGGPINFSVIPQRLPMIAVAFVLAVLLGGGQEEFGWRGFALPYLQEAYGALAASLVIGVVWAVWHLPLFLMDAPRNQSGSFLLYTGLVLGLSILLTWCYNSTGGSVLVAMLFHGGINASGNFLPASIEVLNQWSMAIDVGMLGGVWITVLAVLVWSGPYTLSRSGLPDSPIDDIFYNQEVDTG